MSIILKTKNKEDWLEKRKNLVTATDVSKLYHSKTRATWEKLKRQKLGEPDSFTGNKYTEWGNEREPLIAEYMAHFVDSRLEWNESTDSYQSIWVSDDNPRFACTPDMVGDGIGCQIKTRKNFLPKQGIDQYLSQTMWEFLITGCDEYLLAIEPYSEDNGDFIPGPVQFFPIHWDSDLVDELKATATDFLAFLDDGIEPAWMTDSRDIQLAELLAEHERAIEAFDAAKADLDSVKDRIREHVGDGKVICGGWSVSISTPKPSVRFDSKKFKSDHPDLADEYMQVTAPGSPRLSIRKAA